MQKYGYVFLAIIVTFLFNLDAYGQWVDTGANIYTQDNVLVGKTSNQYGGDLELFSSSNPNAIISGSLSGGGTAGYSMAIASSAGSWVNFANKGDFVIRSIGLNSKDLVLATRNSNAGAIRFGTGTAGSVVERMAITSSGKVGIGVSNPTQTFEVDGTASFSEKVGIGVSNPVQTLEVDGTSTFTGSTSVSGEAAFGNATNSNTLTFLSASGDLNPNLIPSGNVKGSIGTSTFRLKRIYTDELYRRVEFTLSDRKIKKEISPITSALEKIMRLEGVTYRFNPSAMGNLSSETASDIGDPNQIGFIAQQVEEVLPELVTETGDLKAVNYEGVIPVLVEAMKQQQEIITRLAAALNENGIKVDLSVVDTDKSLGGEVSTLSTYDEDAVSGDLKFNLESNYPNPFNPQTEISFTLPEVSNVDLIVYDVTGREVARLLDRSLNAGSHQVTWDASNMPSGVYIYRLTAGNHTETRRMTLVK